MSRDLSILTSEARPSDTVAALSLGNVVREYLTLYANGPSHTARAKRLDCDRFLLFLSRLKRTEEIDYLLVKDWDFSATQRFVDDCLRVGESPATAARRLATLKHMGRILAERIPGFINPAREVKPPRQQATRPKSITSDEIAQIQDKSEATTSDNPSFIALRNRTLLYLLLDTGLRADEIRLLKMAQLDESLNWIRKVRTKGRRFRDVYITSSMTKMLQEYLAARSKELGRIAPNISPTMNAKLPLFISLYRASVENPVTFEMGSKTIWRAIRSQSVDTKLHPHLLRHTFATELLEESRDIRLVAQALGHSDVRVTMRYTERGNEEVAAALEKTRSKKQR